MPAHVVFCLLRGAAGIRELQRGAVDSSPRRAAIEMRADGKRVMRITSLSQAIAFARARGGAV